MVCTKPLSRRCTDDFGRSTSSAVWVSWPAKVPFVLRILLGVAVQPQQTQQTQQTLHNHYNPSSHLKSAPVCESPFVLMDFMMSTSGVDTVTAAARRRQRRLRAHLRYARMTVAMALAESSHHTSRGQRFARAGRRGARSTTRYDDRGLLLPSRSSSSCGSRPACLVAPRGLRRRSSSAPWSSSLTSFLWCRSWTLLSCWGRLGWWTSCGSSTRRRWTSWLSPCPRSLSTGFLNAARVVDRGEQNSWWKCLRSYRTLLYSSRMSSSPSTFQFLMIVVAGAVEEAFKVSLGDRVQQRFVELNSSTFQFLKVVEGWAVEVFKVSPRNRAQQRFMEQITLIFQFLTVVLEEEVFKASSQDRVQLLLHLTLVLRKKLGMGFFALFPCGKKVRGWVRTRGQNWVRTLIHGLRRLRTPTTRLWRSRRRRWW